MDGFQPAADRPHRLLGQRTFERRHVNTAIADRTLADALQEDFIALVTKRQITQIRGNTAGNGAQTVAACAILVVGGISDADRGLILSVRIGFEKVGAEILEARRINS